MRNPDPNKKLDKVLVEQSSELFEAAQRGGENEQRALADWLLQSRRHVRTHLFVTALEEELTHIDPERRIAIPDIPGNHPPVIALNSSAGSATTKVRSRWIWSAAAAVIVAVTAFFIASHNQWQSFTTAVGEQRAISLPDGSLVQLNTDSQLKVRFSDTARDIRLLEGEALFKVQKDQARPFQVSTSDATIVAVGTQFNVYQLAGHTKVSVLEGRVRVTAGNAQTATAAAPPLLKAGEEAEVRKNSRIEQRSAPDVADAAAWTHRQVVFKQEPLESVIREFNRYRKTPRIQVDDDSLATRRYSGIFDIDDPKSLEEVLANEPDVAIERDGDTIIVRRRH